MLHRKSLLRVSIIASAAVLWFSCTEEKEETCIAGNGGTVRLVLFPEHHGEAIPSLDNYADSAFIKFNAQDFPGDDPSKYDLVITGAIGSDSVVVENLKCGKYYIYMAGFDTSIAERVRGGIPYVISEGASGVKNVIVPVTED
jgi:hypothetical protein